MPVGPKRVGRLKKPGEFTGGHKTLKSIQSEVAQ